MVGQIRGDIDRMTNTVISVAEEMRQTGRWAQAAIREVYDGFTVEFVVDPDKLGSLIGVVKSKVLDQPMPDGEIVLPVSMRVVIKEKGE